MTTKEIYLQFVGGLSQIEAAIVSALLEKTAKLKIDQNGNIKDKRAAKAILEEVAKVIENAIKEGGFYEAVEALLNDMDVIEDNVISVHKEVNKITPAKSMFAQTKKLYADQARKRLIEGGIRAEFDLPLQQAMYSAIRNNASIISLERSIRSGVQDNLKRWAGEAARDAVFGFQGAMHDAVKAEYNMNGFKYVGSIRENTRGQCLKWMALGEAKDEQWEQEIKWAKRGGSYKGKKVQGFNKTTSIENFSTFRGGFNCLHEAIPIIIDE